MLRHERSANIAPKRTRFKYKVLEDRSVEPSKKSVGSRFLHRLGRLLTRWRFTFYKGGAYTFNYRSTVLLFLTILGIAFIAWGAASYAIMRETPVSKRATLQENLWSHVRDQRFAEAELLVDELIAIDPHDDALHLYKAFINEQLGQSDVARALMLELEQRQNPEAAAWLLDDGFDLSDVGDWDNERKRRFEKLALLARGSISADKVITASNRLASFYVSVGENGKAINTLADLGERDPPSLINAAALCFQQGDVAKGRQFALQGRHYFERVVADRPEDDSSRLQLSRAMTMTGAEEQAIEILSDGFELTRQPALQQAAGEVLVSWAKRIKSEGNQVLTFLPRAQLLHRAAQCAPQDAAVLAAHLDLLKECEANRKLRLASLESALSLGLELEAMHFLLGVWLALDDRLADACVHLHLASKSGPHLPTVVNNLAIAMSQKTGDLEDALLLSNLALAVLPDQPHFCETRGRILMALGRFGDAIPNLIDALQREELKPIVYPQLLSAYRQTGNEAEASEIEADIGRLEMSTSEK